MEIKCLFVVLLLIGTAAQNAESQTENSATASVETMTALLETTTTLQETSASLLKTTPASFKTTKASRETTTASQETMKSLLETTKAYKSLNFLKDEINPFIFPAAVLVALVFMSCLGWVCCFRHTHIIFCQCQHRERSYQVQTVSLLTRSPVSSGRNKFVEKARLVFLRLVKHNFSRSQENKLCDSPMVAVDDVKASIV